MEKSRLYIVKKKNLNKSDIFKKHLQQLLGSNMHLELN